MSDIDEGGPPHPGHSQEQQAAERLLLDRAERRLGVRLTKIPQFVDGTRVDVDGVSESPHVLVEVYAHYGRLRGSQPFKVMNDAMKLSLFPGAARRILLFADPAAAAGFQGSGWRAFALHRFGIEVMVETLALEQEAKIREAQTSMLLADSRSSIQVAAAEGSAKKADFRLGGLLAGAGGGAALGGYSNTNEGKVIAASFADNYNGIIRAVRADPKLQRDVASLADETGKRTKAGDGVQRG